MLLLRSLYAATWTRDPRGTGRFCLLRSAVGNAIARRRTEPWRAWRARSDVREAAGAQVGRPRMADHSGCSTTLPNAVWFQCRNREPPQSAAAPLPRPPVPAPSTGTMIIRDMCERNMTAVGFEPTQLALVELESTPLDHSGSCPCHRAIQAARSTATWFRRGVNSGARHRASPVLASCGPMATNARQRARGSATCCFLCPSIKN